MSSPPCRPIQGNIKTENSRLSTTEYHLRGFALVPARVADHTDPSANAHGLQRLPKGAWAANFKDVIYPASSGQSEDLRSPVAVTSIVDAADCSKRPRAGELFVAA
jgi:hypothetical protein